MLLNSTPQPGITDPIRAYRHHKFMDRLDIPERSYGNTAMHSNSYVAAAPDISWYSNSTNTCKFMAQATQPDTPPKQERTATL